MRSGQRRPSHRPDGAPGRWMWARALLRRRSAEARRLHDPERLFLSPLPPRVPDRHRSDGRVPRHWGLLLLLIAAAVPVQLDRSVPLIGYPSLLDVALLGALWSLFAGLALKRVIVIRHPALFIVLAIPVYVTALSMLWSQDLVLTTRTALTSVFGLLVYVYVLREMSDLPAEQIYRYMRWFVYLLIVPSVLLLLRIPGFAPQETGLDKTSTDYLGYFTRFSHPFIGRSNNLATVLAFFVPILAHRALVTRASADRVAAVAVITAVVLTQSRGVLLALLVVCPLLLLSSPELRRSRGRMLRAVGRSALVAAAALGLLIRLNPETGQFFSTRFTAAGVSERATLLDQGWDRVTARPLAGYGAGVAPLGATGTVDGPAHNTYLQQLISFGIPLGVLVSVSLIATVLFFFTRRTTAGLVIGYAVLGQLLIFASQSSFEGTVLRVLFYLSLGLGVALVQAEGDGTGVQRLTPDARAPAPAHRARRSAPVVDLTGIDQRRW
jgi:O-antigen ligase